MRRETAVMHVPNLIERKRDGGVLAAGEIRALIRAYTDGRLPDYQMSALAMAVFFRGMNLEETIVLTEAMQRSGRVLEWPAAAPPRVDKHSTGGIGDKTALVFAPLLACDGCWVPMLAGRGLGITGGTIDKLESIPGYRTRLGVEELQAVVQRVGCAIAGQSEDLCPADRRLYALRDVTATVPSIPLLTSSILSKKLAEGLDRLVLDVKFGSGAFMHSEADARILADSLVAVGRALGVAAQVRLNAMNEATGEAAGNALEVMECVRCLQGGGPPDLEALVLDLVGEVSDSPRALHAERLRNGEAWQKFQAMVEAQGGDVAALERLDQIHAAPVQVELAAPASGVLRRLDAGVIGRTLVMLGAGRARATDRIDPAVGVDRVVKTGTEVQAGEALLRVHARTQEAARQALVALRAAVVIE
jgi:pyrimidine-nucleoside phosphorylase